MVEAAVGTAILVDESVLVEQRDHGRDGAIVLVGNTNLERISKAVHQVAEPPSRLRGHSVARSRHLEETIEIIEQRIRRPLLVSKPLALGATDLPLDRVLVESPKQRSQVRTQIQLMEVVGHGTVTEGCRKRKR